MNDKKMIKRVCTKDNPFVSPLKDNEVWTHKDAYDPFPEHEFRIVMLYCPNCQIDIPVDMDPDGPSLEKSILDKNGHTADCCRKENHSEEWHTCEECQASRSPCKLCINCSVLKGICSHCKQRIKG